MSFRYRVLFYHENQRWVNTVEPLLDIPLFHLMITDSAPFAEKQIETGEVDIIVTGISTNNFLFTVDENNSLTIKPVYLWNIADQQPKEFQIILLCTYRELTMASHIVQKGKASDYFIVDPILDRNRLFVTLMKTVETGMLRDIVQKRVLETEKLPTHFLESVEVLQNIRNRYVAPTLVTPSYFEAPTEDEEEAFDPYNLPERKEKDLEIKITLQDDKLSSTLSEVENVDDDTEIPHFPKPVQPSSSTIPTALEASDSNLSSQPSKPVSTNLGSKDDIPKFPAAKSNLEKTASEPEQTESDIPRFPSPKF